MVIRETIKIHAPLATVWDVFSRLDEWEAWNDVCQECCLIEGDEMASGACFTFKLRPYWFPMKITPRIVKCEPGQEVVWAGSRLGVHAEHSFQFEEKDDHVLLISEERFHGFMLLLSRLVLAPQRLHQLSKELMESIKKRAEACAGGGLEAQKELTLSA